MSSHGFRRASLVSLLVVAALALSGVALAAGGSVSLKVKLEYRKAPRTACGKTKSFRLFHRGGRIEARGFVLPAPASHTAVRIELRRCVRGRWRDAGSRSATTKLGSGKFKAFFSATPLAPASRRRRAATYYYARAVAAGGRSDKAYFAVTN